MGGLLEKKAYKDIVFAWAAEHGFTPVESEINDLLWSLEKIVSGETSITTPNPQPVSAALEAFNEIDAYIMRDEGEPIDLAIETIRQAPAQTQIPDGSKCNLCHKDMISLLDAYDMIKYLLPLAKGYVHANAGIKSTENIIEDAEAMLSSAPAGKGE